MLQFRGHSSSRQTLLFATILLAVLATPNSSLGGQTLAGQVIHLDSQRPAGGALISLFDDSVHVVATVRADTATGMFYLDAPHPGRFRVVISLPTGAAYVASVERFDSTETHERQFSLPPLVVPTKDTAGLYFAIEVDTMAFPRGRLMVPAFSSVHWASGITPDYAEISFTVVIDTTGRAEMDSFQTLSTSDAGFANAIRQDLRNQRFTPAWKNGHRVRMIWQNGIVIQTFTRGDRVVPGGRRVQPVPPPTR